MKRPHASIACHGKKPWPSREAALGGIAGFMRAGAARGLMAAYRCPHCGEWHIGHRRGRGQRRKR